MEDDNVGRYKYFQSKSTQGVIFVNTATHLIVLFPKINLIKCRYLDGIVADEEI